MSLLVHLPADLPERLRRERDAQGYSQTELAQLSGVGRVTISRIERANQEPTRDTLQSLCRVLGAKWLQAAEEE